MIDERRPADDERSRITGRAVSSLPSLSFRRKRIALWTVGLILFVALGYVVWRYVGTVVLGLFVYYVTRPVFERIHARVESRTAAVVVSLLVVALPVLVLVGWTLSIAFQALSRFLASESSAQFEALVRPYVDLSAVLRNTSDLVRGILADPTRLSSFDLGPFVSGLTTTVVSSLGLLVNVGLHGFVVLVMAFYLLRDDYRIAGWARRTFLGEDDVIETYFVAVDRDLKNVYFGNILNALVTGILAAVTYVLLNGLAPDPVRIPQPGLVGLLVGAACLVPVIGIKLVWVPVALFLAARASIVAPETLWFPALFAVV
ncbi:MAG: AI-2E family transporter, partial [Salinigranum sp.]